MEQEQEQYKIDLEQLSDDDFITKYKATKRQYKLIIRSLKVLTELHESLREPGPLEIDPDIIEGIVYLVEDLSELMDQMELAASWAEDK